MMEANACVKLSASCREAVVIRAHVIRAHGVGHHGAGSAAIVRDGHGHLTGAENAPLWTWRARERMATRSNPQT
jgi:hypothetical protein